MQEHLTATAWTILRTIRSWLRRLSLTTTTRPVAGWQLMVHNLGTQLRNPRDCAANQRNVNARGFLDSRGPRKGEPMHGDQQASSLSGAHSGERSFTGNHADGHACFNCSPAGRCARFRPCQDGILRRLVSALTMSIGDSGGTSTQYQSAIDLMATGTTVSAANTFHKQ